MYRRESLSGRHQFCTSRWFRIWRCYQLSPFWYELHTLALFAFRILIYSYLLPYSLFFSILSCCKDHQGIQATITVINITSNSRSWFKKNILYWFLCWEHDKERIRGNLNLVVTNSALQSDSKFDAVTNWAPFGVNCIRLHFWHFEIYIFYYSF